MTHAHSPVPNLVHLECANDVAAPADRLFPLLCLVREYEWIEGWGTAATAPRPRAASSSSACTGAPGSRYRPSARSWTAPRDGVAAVLEQRLVAPEEDLSRVRAQQDVIVRILGGPELARRCRGLDREGWTALLRAAGLDEAAMLR